MIPTKFGPFPTNRFDVIVIFVNFNWSPAAILDFEKFNFRPKGRLGVPRRSSFSNLVNVGQTVSEKLRFLCFSKWRPAAILDFKIQTFYDIFRLGGPSG